MQTLLLTNQDLRKLIKIVGVHSLMDIVIDSLEKAFVDFDERFLKMQPRTGFNYQEPFEGVIEWMPIIDYRKDMAIKMVAYNPMNPQYRNLPTILSTLSLYDFTTGHLKFLCDGTLPTAIRTGAASAIISKILAQPTSEVIGLIGCGAQAVTQLHALSRIFKIKKVLIYDIDSNVSATFSKRAAFLNLDITVSPLNILEKEADIICTATSVAVGHGPVIEGDNLKSNVHVNAIGSDLPGKIEIPYSILKNSIVCPDFLEQAIVEGECQQLKQIEIGPSLITIVKNASFYQKYSSQMTVFDSTGFSLEDKVILEIFMQFSEKFHLGQQVEIETIFSDPRNPYGDFLSS